MSKLLTLSPQDTREKWTNAGPTFPRKQLVRNRWLSLNGEWDFLFDHDQLVELPERIEDWPLKIRVPFCPESAASGLHDTDFHKRCWYRKEVEFEIADQKRILLHFGAVDYIARVWINGHYLGKHEGGHTPFTFEITHWVRRGESQTIVVRADDDPHDLAKPRGKQDWQLIPHSIWYPRTTGIWQTVWIEEVPEVYIDRLRWTPFMENWEIGLDAFIKGPTKEDLQLQVKLEANGRLLVNDIYQAINHEAHRRIALSDPGIDDYRNELLWSPEKPTLIQAEVTLWCNGALLDQVQSYTALRGVSADRGRFLLNGRPYYLRMVLDQGYWPESLMTPPTCDALRRDIELAKAAGFNGGRKHQKIEDPDYFYWADVLGFVVWAEMPSAYRFTHESVERLHREWTEVIDRDLNHPSIIVWVPFNESWGVPDIRAKAAHQHCVQAMYHLTKTLDPTRPVIGNDGWESTATDILGIHDYDDQPARLQKKYDSSRLTSESLERFRPGGRAITVEGYPLMGQPVMLTEFGGISCIESAEPDSANWGYSVCQTPAEFRDRYEALLDAVNRLECIAGFCYTQFVDTFQETNGLFRMDRTPKFSVSAMARATRGGDMGRGELVWAPPPAPLPPHEENMSNEDL